MKQGKSVKELAVELQRQKSTMRDFKAPTHLMQFGKAGTLGFTNGSRYEQFGANELFIKQLGSWAGIPAKYYELMQVEAPELLATNVNHWLRTNKETRLVRTVDNTARAFLSHRYRTIDNVDILQSVLPVFAERNVTHASCDVTEKRLYLKVINKSARAEIKKGDVVEFGVVVSNSEVGCGAVRVEPLINRLICENGAIISDAGLKKFHVGRKLEEFDEALEIFKDDTVIADNRAFFLKLRDTVNAALDTAVMTDLARSLEEGTKRRLGDDFQELEEVVELAGKRHGFSETEGENILKQLIAGNDLSQWGLANAVTRVAQDVTTYERATELEKAGGAIMTLDATGWEQLVDA